MPSAGEPRPGNKKGTNPGPPDRTGRTRRTASVLRTPPPVLNSTVANCGPPFGTKRPQVQILSPRPASQVSDVHNCRASVACLPLQPPSRRPEGTKREREGTPWKAGADFDRQKNTLPPRTAHQAPRHSRDPQGTLIPRPQRRSRFVGTPARQEAVPIRSRQARQARGPSPSPLSEEDPVDPIALNSTN